MSLYPRLQKLIDGGARFRASEIQKRNTTIKKDSRQPPSGIGNDDSSSMFVIPNWTSRSRPGIGFHRNRRVNTWGHNCCQRQWVTH